jgi:hypothetical protein
MSRTKLGFQPVLGKLFTRIYLWKCPGIDLFTETSSLERFTKNPEKGLERTSLINPFKEE